ncbi:energy-coupling factor transporter transmembrane protein EcfT [Streptococcus pasteurianus]|uniref:energy-coupling factor transporter transmembrane component T n=2 Tax=Streptococcus TaxID=1301 RepID=UPI0010A8A929|nr:energy-coupling factor transporter transmembrane component T [Streptococcus pasteurianus]MCY7247424.1 energy-coupling factor transporter transmembrane protein EcfT [Streptococcus pasteurianus]MDV5119538.1 energy-coupling factor transporter transmembrane component T [Streptococcus pasteurianus]MDV5125230.1 energy-coupling factor transporter transmembrane component T [Streptococcus pasteurianus]MDV5152997.1 energy-coupling factor transporter transmembrane component T [Streptococcus pasteurianu
MNAVTIDVRTKIILLFFTNILLLLHISDGYECLLMIGLGLLFFLEGDRKRALYYVIPFLALIVLEDYLLSPEYVTSYIALFLVGGRRFLPCFMIGGSILKGSVHEFIVTMRTWHMPEGLLIAIAVMMRFLPMIKEHYRMICDSLKIRGIFTSRWMIIRHPLMFFEYILVPLLMNATRIAQDLTIASMTKGVASQNRKTSYMTYRFGLVDYAAYGFMVIFVLALIMGVTL